MMTLAFASYTFHLNILVYADFLGHKSVNMLFSSPVCCLHTRAHTHIYVSWVQNMNLENLLSTIKMATFNPHGVASFICSELLL